MTNITDLMVFIFFSLFLPETGHVATVVLLLLLLILLVLTILLL